jgi:hypothetical protein
MNACWPLHSWIPRFEHFSKFDEVFNLEIAISDTKSQGSALEEAEIEVGGGTTALDHQEVRLQPRVSGAEQ